MKQRQWGRGTPHPTPGGC